MYEAFEYIAGKVLDLSLKLYTWYNKITARSSEFLTLFYFLVYFALVLIYDVSEFDIKAIWTNFMNTILYVLVIWAQVAYHKTVKTLKNNSTKDVLSIHIVRNWFTSWHTLMTFLSVVTVILSVFSLSLMLRSFSNLLWHASCIYYADFGGKSLFSKVKEKVENWVDAKTPQFAPMPI